MRCFDCAVEQNRETEACASCTTCGAGLCLEHTIEGYAEERVPYNLGNPAAHRLPGRRLYCHTCTPKYMERASRTRVARAVVAS